MPYGVLDNRSVMEAWNEQPILQPSPEADAFVKYANSLNESPGVFNSPEVAAVSVPQASVQQPTVNAVPNQLATQIVSQGAGRRPTTDEYKAFAADYLAKKGYSYDDAMELMGPSIQAYALQEKIYNRNEADRLIEELNNTKIDSPEYRTKAMQLLRLDPTMGQFMLKEGVGPREQYLRGQKLDDLKTANQQKKDYAVFNSDLQLNNFMRKQEILDAYKKQQAENTIKMLVNNYNMSPQQAATFVYGGGKSGYRGASNNTQGQFTNNDLKLVQKEYDDLVEQYQNGTLPDAQRGRMMYYGNILQRYKDSLVGYGQQQSPMASLQSIFDQGVAQSGGYSDDLVKAFRQRAKESGYDLSDKDIETITAKYRNK